MEMSLTASSFSKPLFFSNQSLSKTHFLTAANNTNTSTTIKTRRPTCIKAANSSPSIAQTLSTNWDVSNFAVNNNTSSPYLPKFEELDTTNMLLRQRIIFLGSQVIFVVLSFTFTNGFVYCCI